MTTLATVSANPAWGALSGVHADLGDHHGAAARYHADVSPFHAVADPADPSAWRDLAALVGPGGTATLVEVDAPPTGWTVEHAIRGVRLVADTLDPVEDDDALTLGPADVAEMLDLVRRTQPGPFLPRTIALGRYVGIREGGRLVAMAGERLHPPGATEISAVCTDPSVRGRGLASRLVRTVAAGIVARGETPFLHTSAANHPAISLYRTLGFTPPRPVGFTTVRAPRLPGKDA